MMPGYEIRSDVTAIGAAQADASLFDVPPDTRQVQRPLGGSCETLTNSRQTRCLCPETTPGR